MKQNLLTLKIYGIISSRNRYLFLLLFFSLPFFLQIYFLDILVRMIKNGWMNTEPWITEVKFWISFAIMHGLAFKTCLSVSFFCLLQNIIPHDVNGIPSGWA